MYFQILIKCVAILKRQRIFLRLTKTFHSAKYPSMGDCASNEVSNTPECCWPKCRANSEAESDPNIEQSAICMYICIFKFVAILQTFLLIFGVEQLTLLIQSYQTTVYSFKK